MGDLLNQDHFDESSRITRAGILKGLYIHPVNGALRDYFQELTRPSPTWTVEAFVTGIERFTNLFGKKESEYFPTKLHGLHLADSVVPVWNDAHPQYPITAFDQGFRRPHPPTWRAEIRDGSWLLIYAGEASLSQGLNELIHGPTALDCGMFCQLLLWMAIRSLLGDQLFDRIFDLPHREFALSQRGYNPLNADCVGNLLYHLFDSGSARSSERSAHEDSIELRTFFNHPVYIMKHPGGSGRLQNVIRHNRVNYILTPIHRDGPSEV